MVKSAKWSWSLPQRRALIGLIALAAAALAVEAYLRPIYMDEVLPGSGPRAGELVDRIDPNTASAGELATIPQLGPGRAREMIAYRESYTAAHPGRAAFERPEDLRNIRGIGPATIEKIVPHLVFDQAAPQTEP
jgi:competence ComEA-like helix-hairpin-helix protein